jgi:hypothetical protein
LKAVQETAMMTWLQQLFNRCVREGKTPRSWNESEIYLLTKDAQQRRDATNLRPISIICIFRKIFERLLLLQIQGQPWAKLHPAQAGFRRSYSTYSNAAVVHALLSTKSRTTAVFLDFKSAFDVVDHQRLDEKLLAKGCPEVVRNLIQSLMFLDHRSRIQINGQMTDWFLRSRGVLQGSPLTPWLFNLFVDDLLYKVNERVPGPIPVCLFYADDGVLVADSKTDLAELLEVIEAWTMENAIFLNPGKCAEVTSRPEMPTLSAYGVAIPHVEVYSYLGFPVTANGIDFEQHLTQRIDAAIGRAQWLGVFSNSWGAGHRLRVYKTYLAPMFEYGAPLVWAWAQNHPDEFQRATSGFRKLMGWVANRSDKRWRITANLCGLSQLDGRFQHLKTAYYPVLEEMLSQTPLKQLLLRVHPASELWTFAKNLGSDESYEHFKAISNFQPTIRTALSRFLRRKLRRTVQEEALQSHLTQLVPMTCRTVPGLRLADISLSAPAWAQDSLFQYRK